MGKEFTACADSLSPTISKTSFYRDNWARQRSLLGAGQIITLLFLRFVSR